MGRARDRLALEEETTEEADGKRAISKRLSTILEAAWRNGHWVQQGKPLEKRRPRLGRSKTKREENDPTIGGRLCPVPCQSLPAPSQKGKQLSSMLKKAHFPYAGVCESGVNHRSLGPGREGREEIQKTMRRKRSNGKKQQPLMTGESRPRFLNNYPMDWFFFVSLTS